MKNTEYLVALQMVDGLGPVRLKMLLDFYQDPKIIWDTPNNELRQFKISSPILEGLNTARKNINPQSELEKIISKGIKIISIYEEQYPKSLKNIYNPPILLYCLGTIPNLSNTIGVVGTRQVSGYGKAVTGSLTARLVESGFVIVSGLARGVDTIAHKTAVEKNGHTIAVLGGGLNKIFPAENAHLAATIAQNFGVVISEYHPDAPSLPGNFPARNRIISGLSQAVLVTEAAVDSGSLITARLTLEQGKGVYAVPGPINSSRSLGPLELIRDGATLVTKAEDILQDFGTFSSSKPKQPLESLAPIEQAIVEHLANEKMHLDELTRKIKQPSSAVASSLLKLEIAGFVSSEGNGVYSKNL